MATKTFRSSAAFGKRIEYWVIWNMLKEGIDVYVPLVDDHAVDAIITRKDGSTALIQIKARSNEVIAGDAALFAAIPHDEVRLNYWFVFYSERMNMTWVMTSEEFFMEAVTNKSGKNVGRKSIWFNGHRTNRATGIKEEYCKPQWEKYIATDFSRIAKDANLVSHTAMNFRDWMIHDGLTEKSAQSYDGALQGVLSQWAMDNGLLFGPLTALTSAAALAQLMPELQALPVFKERNARGHHMYSSALQKFAQYLEHCSSGSDVESDLNKIVADPTTTNTEKAALVACRVGQGTFRQKLLLHWKGCAVTGFTDTNLLVASHIKPWKDSTNTERLDQWNGLLLTPNLDKAFDRGLITFAEDGSILLSPLFTEADKLGIHAEMKVTLSPEHATYMQHHRSKEFQSK